MNLPDKIESKEQIEVAFEDCKRKKNTGSLFVVFIDGNGIKKVNDKYGHLVGDEVIFEIANTLSSVVREEDHIVRFGGDEFVLFLSDFDKSKIREFIGRIQKSIRENPTLIEKVGGITVSAGIAKFEESKHVNLASVLQEADMLMYEAKHNAPYYSAFYDDKIKLIKNNKKDKRKAGIMAERKRSFFTWVVGTISKENPSFDLTILINSTRTIWKINGEKVIGMATPNETLRRVKIEYEREHALNKHRKKKSAA